MFTVIFHRKSQLTQEAKLHLSLKTSFFLFLPVSLCALCCVVWGRKEQEAPYNEFVASNNTGHPEQQDKSHQNQTVYRSGQQASDMAPDHVIYFWVHYTFNYAHLWTTMNAFQCEGFPGAVNMHQQNSTAHPSLYKLYSRGTAGIKISVIQ